MKRSEMILEILKIYDTIPEGASSYHIVDTLLYAFEKRGMKPPVRSYPMHLVLNPALPLISNTWEPENE